MKKLRHREVKQCTHIHSLIDEGAGLPSQAAWLWRLHIHLARPLCTAPLLGPDPAIECESHKACSLARTRCSVVRVLLRVELCAARPIHMLKYPVPQNTTLYGNRAIAHSIS